MLKILAPVLMFLALGCATASQTGAPQTGEQPTPEVEQQTRARFSGCDGLETMAKVSAKAETNPIRAIQNYDIKKLRGCLEGEIIGFRLRPKKVGEELPQDDPSRLTVEVLVNENRGFTISHGHPHLLEEPAFVDEGMPDGVLSEAEQARWIAEHERKMEGWRELQAEEEAVRAAYEEKWPAFALSASIGDRVRAQCDLFNTSSMRRSSRGVNSVPTRFEDGVVLHHNCVMIER